MPILVAGLREPPSVNEFLKHPDFRQIGAFFIGWVFITSLKYIATSTLANNMRVRLLSTNTALGDAIDEKAGTLQSDTADTYSSVNQNHLLTFTLNLCFAFASLAHFISLLAFGGDDAVCAFVVAWEQMATQLTRLVALIILLRELRAIGLKTLEYAACWAVLLLGLGLIFANSALSIGQIQLVKELGVFLCYRKQFLPTSLATSLLYLALELYVFGQLILLVPPSFATVRYRAASLYDARVLRAMSLIAFELLTAVPSAKFTSIVAGAITYSLGALVILVAFNIPLQRPQNIATTNMPARPSDDSNSIVTIPQVHSQVGTRGTIDLSHHPYTLSSESRRTESSHPSIALETESAEDAVYQVAYRRRISTFQNSAQAAIDDQLHRPGALPNPNRRSRNHIMSKDQLKQFSTTATPPADSLPRNEGRTRSTTPRTADYRQSRIKSMVSAFSSSSEESPVVDDNSSGIYGSDIIRIGSQSSRKYTDHTKRVDQADDGATDLESRQSMEPRYPSQSLTRASTATTHRRVGAGHLSVAFGPGTKQAEEDGEESVSRNPSWQAMPQVSKQPAKRRPLPPPPLKFIPAQPLKDVVALSDDECFNV